MLVNASQATLQDPKVTFNCICMDCIAAPKRKVGWCLCYALQLPVSLVVAGSSGLWVSKYSQLKVGLGG